VVDRVIIIERTVIIPEFIIDDLITDTFVYRLPGTPPEEATTTPQIVEGPEGPTETETQPPPETETEPPPQTETEPPPETEAAPPQTSDITALGGVSVSSEYPSGEYPASLAVDGSTGTSWFSGGSNTDGSASTFTWTTTSGAPVFIETLNIVSNAGNDDSAVREGFGFDQVEIKVLNGDVVAYSETIQLGGTPDPDVVVSPNAVGTTVLLTFSGHEDPTCGGFAELVVVGSEETDAAVPEPPSVLSSTDYCTALQDYIAQDTAYLEEFENANESPEYREFVGLALRDLANIAPSPVNEDWAFFRDAYEADPDGYFSGENAALSSDAAAAASERIFTHAQNECGIDFSTE
jgi:hypothetical protein